MSSNAGLDKQAFDKERRIKFIRDNEEAIRKAFADPGSEHEIVAQAMREGLFSGSTTMETALSKLKNVAKRHIGWNV